MFIIDNMWLIFLGSSNQAEWPIKQVSHDQQLGEQDQPPQETGHHHPGRGDRPLPRLHDLVHVRLSSTLLTGGRYTMDDGICDIYQIFT